MFSLIVSVFTMLNYGCITLYASGLNGNIQKNEADTARDICTDLSSLVPLCTEYLQRFTPRKMVKLRVADLLHCRFVCK